MVVASLTEHIDPPLLVFTMACEVHLLRQFDDVVQSHLITWFYGVRFWILAKPRSNGAKGTPAYLIVCGLKNTCLL